MGTEPDTPDGDHQHDHLVGQPPIDPALDSLYYSPVDQKTERDRHSRSRSRSRSDSAVNTADGFGAGFYDDGYESDDDPDQYRPTDQPTPKTNSHSSSGFGSGAHSQPGVSGSPSYFPAPSQRGYAASVTLIPDDPDRPLVECGRSSYTRDGDRARVGVPAQAFPDRGAPPGQSDWELVVATGDGQVIFGGVIVSVRRAIKRAQYRVRIAEPDNSPPTFLQNSSP